MYRREGRGLDFTTAPLAHEDHGNLSPKGGDSFRVLSWMEVAYQDYSGSGAETAAHLRENGRIVIMFCAFAGGPQILRLHGNGMVVTPDNPAFAELTKPFPVNTGTRAIIHVTVQRVTTSCGYSVPLLEFTSHRDALDKWANSKGADRLKEYREQKNQLSIDGLPAFDRGV